MSKILILWGVCNVFRVCGTKKNGFEMNGKEFSVGQGLFLWKSAGEIIVGMFRLPVWDGCTIINEFK